MKKQYRIKKSSEIEKILHNKMNVGNKYFTIYTVINNETEHIRYAMSVGKKVGNAVTRNKVKRQIRSIISNCNLTINKNIDFFIIAKPITKDVSFEMLKYNLEYLLKKINLIAQGE